MIGAIHTTGPQGDAGHPAGDGGDRCEPGPARQAGAAGVERWGAGDLAQGPKGPQVTPYYYFILRVLRQSQQECTQHPRQYTKSITLT
eukprot:334883-Pyramimonas_sp.AAC.1